MPFAHVVTACFPLSPFQVIHWKHPCPRCADYKHLDIPTMYIISAYVDTKYLIRHTEWTFGWHLLRELEGRRRGGVHMHRRSTIL